MHTDNKTPLWKKLNSERTQGEWQMSENKCDVETSDDARLGIFTMFASERDEANAKYTALCVNKFAEMAEALEEVTKYMTLDTPQAVETHKKVLQVLNRIS